MRTLDTETLRIPHLGDAKRITLMEVSHMTSTGALAAGTEERGTMITSNRIDDARQDSCDEPMVRPLFDEIYEVEDSWSDSGMFFDLSSKVLAIAAAAGIDTTGLLPIPFPPYAGKFSNGPVFSEITADLLGASLTNFSVGAAQALGTLPFGVIAGFVYPPEVIAAVAATPEGRAVLGQDLFSSGQVDQLIAATSARPPSAHSALVSMIGLNDIAALEATYDPADPGALIDDALQLAGRDRSGKSRPRPHRLRPGDRHGHLRHAAGNQLPPEPERVSRRSPGDRRCRGRCRQSGARGRRTRAAPAGP